MDSPRPFLKIRRPAPHSFQHGEQSHPARKPALTGGLFLCQGAAEIITGGALFAAPEPILSKVAGAAVALHGADTMTAGWQAWNSGKPPRTMAERAAHAAADGAKTTYTSHIHGDGTVVVERAGRKRRQGKELEVDIIKKRTQWNGLLCQHYQNPMNSIFGKYFPT